MTEHDPTAHAAGAPAETPPAVEFLEGTMVPKLTLEQDAGWLQIALPPGSQLGQETVDALNLDAEAAEYGVATRERARQERSRTFPEVAVSLRDAAKRARIHFYRTFTGSPVAGEAEKNGFTVAAKDEIRPARVITLTRTFYDIVGEHLDQVLVAGRSLYDRSPDTVQQRIDFLIANGVDVRAVLLASPNTLAFRVAHDESGERFLGAARAAEARYRKSLEAAARSGAIIMPRVVQSGEPLGKGLRHPERYDELARVSGLSAAALQAAFPALDRLTRPRFAEVLQAANSMASGSIDPLRVRDVAPLMPKPPKKRGS